MAVVVASGLIVGAGWLAHWLNQRHTSEAASAALILPASLGDYTRSPGQSPTPEATNSTSTVHALYSKGGTTSVLVLLSRPVTDAKVFLIDAAFHSVTASESGYCGTSTDTSLPGCVVVRMETAVLVVGMANQSASELDALASTFAHTLVP